MASAPNTWQVLAEKLQPLIQNGTLDAPSTQFRYSLPTDTPQLDTTKQAPGPPNQSYFQTVHFGKHGVLQDICDEYGDTIYDPLAALSAVAVRPYDNDIRSVLEAVDAALALQASKGVAPQNRYVILVGHSTGGLAIRKFMAEKGTVAVDGLNGRTYQDVVKRIVYVDVPHYGSPMANYVLNLSANYAALEDCVADDADLKMWVNGTEMAPLSVPTDIRVQLLDAIRTNSQNARQWNRVQKELIEWKVGPIDGPIYKLLSVPEDCVYTETFVTGPMTIYGDTWEARWVLSKSFSNLPLNQLEQTPGSISTVIVGRSATAGQSGTIFNPLLDDPEMIGEVMACMMSGNATGIGGTARLVEQAGQLMPASWVPDVPNDPRSLTLARTNGSNGFSNGMNLDDLEYGDGIVTLRGQNSHPKVKMSIQDEWAHIAGAYKAGATANWEPILEMVWDSPARVTGANVSQYIRPTDGLIKSFIIFSIDDLYPADASLEFGPTITESIWGGTYQSSLTDAYGTRTPNSNVWPTSLFGYPKRVCMNLETNETAVTTIDNSENVYDREFWPYGALGDSFVQRRVSVMRAPNGDSVQLGPGQIALEMTFLNRFGADSGQFNLAVTGTTRNVIPGREQPYAFSNLAVPDYVLKVERSCGTTTQTNEVQYTRNGSSAATDTWSRTILGDSIAPSFDGDIDLRVNFTQPYAAESVAVYLCNGVDTPRISMTPVAGNARVTLGTIATETLAKTPVGVYRLAIYAEGPNPYAPKLDGHPQSIPWFDPIADSYHAYEPGVDTNHRIFIAPAYVSKLQAENNGAVRYNGEWSSGDWLGMIHSDTRTLTGDTQSWIGPETTIIHAYTNVLISSRAARTPRARTS